MSKSYHETYKDLRGKTKKEIDDMAKDPNSILRRLMKKRAAKKLTIKKRKNLEVKKHDR